MALVLLNAPPGGDASLEGNVFGCVAMRLLVCCVSSTRQSAVNDMTRELGGALGVAVVGSVMPALYANGLPDDVPAAAQDSLGAAVRLGGLVGDSAREAFVDAMATAPLMVAMVAALGAVLAWRHLQG